MITSIITSQEIEKHIDIVELKTGEINNINEYSLRIARGGVFSSYIVKLLQGEPFILGFTGGLGGRYIKNYLDKNRIKSSLLYRENEILAKFLISDKKANTVLIDKNINYDENDFKNLKHKISSSIEKTTVFVLNSSLENPTEINLLRSTMDFLKEKNQFQILALRDGYIDEFVEESPMALIANISQFKACENFLAINEKLGYLLELLRTQGLKNMIIIEKNVLYCISKNKIVKILLDENKNPDISAMSGALALSLKRKYEFEKTMKLIAAVANSFDYRAYPNLLNRKTLDQEKLKIKLIGVYANGDFVENV